MDGSELPSFFSMTNNYSLTLDGASNADVGSYDIKVKAYDDYNPNPSSHIIHWVVKENTLPSFERTFGNHIASVEMIAG